MPMVSAAVIGIVLVLRQSIAVKTYEMTWAIRHASEKTRRVRN